MKRLIPAFMAAIGLLGVTGAEARMGFMDRMGPVNSSAVARNAAMSNQFEIQSSRAALLKSRNPNIRQFARRMISDHSALAAKMQQTLRANNLPIPSQQLDPAHRQALVKLEMLSGPNFDGQYIKDQINGHARAASIMSRYVRTGSNPVFRRLAASSLPVVQHHLALARQLEAGGNLMASR